MCWINWTLEKILRWHIGHEDGPSDVDEPGIKRSVRLIIRWFLSYHFKFPHYTKTLMNNYSRFILICRMVSLLVFTHSIIISFIFVDHLILKRITLLSLQCDKLTISSMVLNHFWFNWSRWPLQIDNLLLGDVVENSFVFESL